MFPKVLGAHQSARHPPCLEQKLPQCYTLNDFLQVSALGHSKTLKKMKFATKRPTTELSAAGASRIIAQKHWTQTVSSEFRASTPACCFEEGVTLHTAGPAHRPSSEAPDPGLPLCNHVLHGLVWLISQHLTPERCLWPSQVQAAQVQLCNYWESQCLLGTVLDLGFCFFNMYFY